MRARSRPLAGLRVRALLAGLGAIALVAACSSGAPVATQAVHPASTTPGPATSATSTTATTTTTATRTTLASTSSSASSAVTTTPVATTTTEPLSANALTAGLGRTAGALAEQLASAWPMVLDPSRSDDERAAAGRLVQLIDRRLAARPEWVATVLDALPTRVRSLVDDDLAAALAPSRSPSPAGPPQTTLPAWTIRDPRPAAELLGFYHEAEAATGVPWTVLAAINLVETRTGRIVGVSSAGAVGPMQFLPSTWAVCCVGDPADDHDAIIGAATYLVRRGALTDLRGAIHGYNPNDAYVEMVSRYAANLAAEPEAYVGYHAWQVFVRTTAGAVRLPVGYAATEPIDAAAYLAAHPQDAG